MIYLCVKCPPSGSLAMRLQHLVSSAARSHAAQTETTVKNMVEMLFRLISC
jgi:hypothetical protein